MLNNTVLPRKMSQGLILCPGGGMIRGDTMTAFHDGIDAKEGRRLLEEKRKVILSKKPAHDISQEFNAVYLSRLEESTGVHRICALYLVKGNLMYREFPFDDKRLGVKGAKLDDPVLLLNMLDGYNWWTEKKDERNRCDGVALVAAGWKAMVKTP